MVLFIVKGKEEDYPYVVLNGNNFYLKAQEVILGSNKYREYATLDEDIKDLEIEVLYIDLEKEDINKKLREVYSKYRVKDDFYALHDRTINKYYQKIYSEPSFDFYQNLRYSYNVEEIIEDFVYRNVSKSWLAAVYDLDMWEVNFILENLPVYYNYLGEE